MGLIAVTEETLRTHEFTTDGPVTVDVSVGSGSIDVKLTDEQAVRVELRHDPSLATTWTQGLSSTLSWLSEQLGEDVGGQVHQSPMTAADQTRIDMVGSRLIVHAPKSLPVRHVPFAVTVYAPGSSSLEIRSASARVTATGEAGAVDVTTTSGEVSVESATGPTHIRTGSGAISVANAESGVRVRTGTGDVRLGNVAAATSVVSGSGAIRVDSADGEFQARTGGGDISVSDVGAGDVNIKSGTGSVRVALRKGVAAQIDLSSATGGVSSDLGVLDTKPADAEDTVVVRARTGTGTVTVTGASA